MIMLDVFALSFVVSSRPTDAYTINLDRQEHDKKYKIILPYDLLFLKTNI